MNNQFDQIDQQFMRHAVIMAKRALGRTGENPPVGCVIVSPASRQVLGVGWTAAGGRPHSETQALALAGEKAQAATAYVTLEPCSHHGQTPPCCDALIKAGIARVVIACSDPDPRVNGRGIAKLKAAGVRVETGLLADEAHEALAGFFSRINRARPFVSLKLALSRDGKIAAKEGVQTAITGPQVKARVHLMRAQADAVMIGSATAKIDDPQLTCRLSGLENRSPIRVVCDSRLNLNPSSKLVQSAQQVPLWLLHCTSKNCKNAAALHQSGAKLISCEGDAAGRVSLPDAMVKLAARGVNNLLLEGGATLAARMLQDDLVDRMVLFETRLDIGPAGVAALADLSINDIRTGTGFQERYNEALGGDHATVYDKADNRAGG